MSAPLSLVGVASYLPERVVDNDFFAVGTRGRKGMFTAPTTRRHVTTESAADMIERAGCRLIDRLGLDPRDIGLLLTNVALPDEAFTGCGAEVAHRLGIDARWIIDLHNSGCVAFIAMIDLARQLLPSVDGRGALLCTVQNAAGRVFAQPEVRLTSQAPVPGDGCGVGYLAPGDANPILSAVVHAHGENARDMTAVAADGRRYWQPGVSPITIGFTEERVAAIIHRGNALVPVAVRDACAAAGVGVGDIDLLVTNQPNPIFLRNWREALELPRERHHDTFDRYGNLFAAGIPVNLEDAIDAGKLAPGDLIALGGFAHAGDYSAGAVLRVGPGGIASGARP